MPGNYVYDDKEMKIRKDGRTIAGTAVKILKYIVVSISLAVFYYLIFAAFINTDEERRLKTENKMLEEVYPEMVRKEQLLADVIRGLEVRDDELYSAVFHSPSPDVSRLSSIRFMPADSLLKNADLVTYSSEVIRHLEKGVSNVNANFMKAFEVMGGEGFVMPPMDLPLKEFSYAMTGASVGEKLSPFYKVKVGHNGLDMITHAGTPVHAVADGVISLVKRSRSGLGNVVEITHDGGYVTRYTHLGEMFAVRGRRVRKGALIGNVGISGQTFAPHLHYEVLKDGEICDPVNYFFASLTPEEYVNVAVISASVEQSMD